MKYTKNLKLKKPALSDFSLIDDISENMDLIDEPVSENKTAGSSSAELIKKLSRKITLTFTADGWSEAAPYTQTLKASGITENDSPERWFDYPAGADASSDFDFDKYDEETGYITYCETGNGEITAVCKKDKPTMDIVVVFKGY